MKKTLVYLASVSILACLIVRPVIRPVNAVINNHSRPVPFMVSEGDPMPSPVPPERRSQLA